jgi:hypothetical protein
MYNERQLGPRTKLERAKEHTRELKAEIDAFINRKPYYTRTERDPDTGKETDYLIIEGELPPRWGAVIGDAIHNLRSSLDLLACQLVLVNGRTSLEGVYFPICKTVNGFEQSLSRLKAKGVGDKAISLLRRINPYKGGNDKLWRLHRLNIDDKHRLLIPMASASDWITMIGTHTDPETGETRRDVIAGMMLAYTFSKSGNRTVQLPPVSQSWTEREYEISVTILCNNGRPGMYQAIDAILDELAAAVERVLNAFDKHLQ